MKNFQSSSTAGHAKITAWQRWEMSAVQPPQPLASEQPITIEPTLIELAPKLLIDEAELLRLRQEAQQAGTAEGHQQGYTTGWQEGYAAGQEMAKTEAKRLHELTLAMPTALRTTERELADLLLTLALDIARQVVRQELTVSPQPILALVRELMQSEPSLNGAPRLLVHPDDMSLINQYLADDLQTAGWQLRSDPAITRGGCQVQANSGELDATLETRWQRVATALGRSRP